MNVKTYLLDKQPIVFQVLKNSFKRNKTTHAYIVSGSKGAPVLDVAKFMVKSFVCESKDEDNLACECCNNCLKIESNNYVDYELINGEDLKTDAIMNLQDNFSKSAVEKEGIKIYIVHLIEKAPISSLNKLLKFIEEPNSNIVAIFTSNSVEKILPTIVSRCQTIQLREFMVKDLVDYLVSEGINKEDAYLLSRISNNADKNLETYNSEEYSTIKDVVGKSLAYLKDKDDMFIVYMQVEGKEILSNKELSELYLDILEVCLLEAVVSKEDNSYEPLFFNNEIKGIGEKYNHLDKMITSITNTKIELLSNANASLAFDKLFISLIDG